MRRGEVEERGSIQIPSELKVKRRNEATMGEEDIETRRRDRTLSEKTLHRQGREFTRFKDGIIFLNKFSNSACKQLFGKHG